MKKTKVALLLAFCSAIVLPASAQKNEVAGVIGRTFISTQTIQSSLAADNKLRFGDGLTFEGNYARHFLGSDLYELSLEVPVVVNLDEDLHAALPNRIPEQYRSFIVTPSARLKLFPLVAVSPWVSLGGGLAHYSASSNLLFGGKNPANTGANTGVLQIGVGLDVKLAGPIRLRGEGRDFWSGVPQLGVTTDKTRQHNLFVAGGIAWQF